MLPARLRRPGLRARLRIVIFAFPVLMLAAALLHAVEAGVYVLRSIPVEGRVVTLHEWPGETIFDRGTTNYEPVFSYSIDGAPRRASVGGAHSSFDIPVGDRARIRVIPDARGNVRLDTWQGLWFMPVVLGLMGGLSLGLAGLLWFGADRVFFGKDRT